MHVLFFMSSRETFNTSKELRGEELKHVETFVDLFSVLGNNPDQQYKKAYEDVVDFAKHLIDTKGKVFWNSHHKNFKEDLVLRYPRYQSNLFQHSFDALNIIIPL